MPDTQNLQIVSDGSRTDTAGVSAHSDLFFLSDRFYPQKSATEAPSQKDHFQGSNSFPYCPYLRFKFFLYLITKPPFHLYYSKTRK